ncbi:MAG: hypothetical protein R3183_06505 [Oleiphilaceae bacterium]|nr:hypothetical protein [Oleiphilaceae bacterium]
MPQLGKWIIWSTLLTLGAVLPAHAVQVCLPQVNAQYPFSTPEGERRLSEDNPVIPGDVYLHVLTLKQTLVELGIKLAATTHESIPLANVLPRHNYVLAYDLLVLLQLWYQEREDISHIPPALHFPRHIQPSDVFAWVDASIGLARCLKAGDRLEIEVDDKRVDANITPRDVYYELDRLMRSVAQQVSIELRLAMQSLRLNQILYFLQDVMVSGDHGSLVVWDANDPSLDQHGPGLELTTDIAAQILAELDGLNDRPAVKLSEDILGRDISTRTQALTFLLSQILGELQSWSQDQRLSIEPPPLAPVVLRRLDETMIQQRLQHIHALLHQASEVAKPEPHSEVHRHD